MSKEWPVFWIFIVFILKIASLCTWFVMIFLPAVLIQYKGPKNKPIAVSPLLWHNYQANSGCKFTLYSVSFNRPNLSNKYSTIRAQYDGFLKEGIFCLI